MILIEVERSHDGEIQKIRAAGHAGYADSGQDIVCASASAVLQTAVIGLIDHLKLKPGIVKEEGFLEIELTKVLKKEKKLLQSAILETALLGLLEIQRNYSRRIEVSDPKPKEGGESCD